MVLRTRSVLSITDSHAAVMSSLSTTTMICLLWRSTAIVVSGESSVHVLAVLAHSRSKERRRDIELPMILWTAKRTRLVSLRRFGLAWVRNYIPMLTHLFCSSHLMPLSTTRCCCWEQCSWSTLCFLRIIIIVIVVVNRTVSCVFVNNSKIGGFFR